MSALPETPLSPADRILEALAPALWAALSPLGRQAQVPENFLPQQTAEARGKTWNATIGQITDGRGGALPLSPMAAALGGLDPARRNQAFLYSPVEGLAELRRLWRERQRRGRPDAPPSGLPLVTPGPVLALALAADLFLQPGRTVVLPESHPPGYPEIFTLRTGARAQSASGPPGIAQGLASLPPGEPAVVVLRAPLPEEPTLPETLAEAAGARPLVVLLDESADEASALYWRLPGLHPNLVPVRIEGTESALGSPGPGIGFLTFPFDPESAAARAIEGKVKMLARAAIGSPPAAGQALLLSALAS
jgi:hypothetical protein